MSAGAASSSSVLAVWPRKVLRLGDDGLGVDLGGLMFVVLTAAAGLAAAYALVHGQERFALGLSFVPLAIWLTTHPTVPLMLLGASIPAVTSISGASEYSTGYKFAASDVLLVMIGTGILLEWTVARPVPVIQALKPVARPVMQYAALMLLLVGFHTGLRDVLKTGQRYELFLLPMVVGAFAAMVGRHIEVLKTYVVAATALAIIFPIYSFGLQHNPIGGFIGNAILVLIAVRPLRRFHPCLFILVPGLIVTLSRGAILATLLGAGVVVALNLTGRRPGVNRIIAFALVGLVAFTAAPASVQQRLTTLSATPQNGDYAPGQYAIKIRQQYAADAHKIIDAHPVTGVGIGNYFQADSQISAGASQDPHEVFLLQAAEGGYPLAVSFGVLLAGVLLALRRMRRLDVAVAAAGVFVATAAHGLVDVYWVRGTPIMAWLLVGMACGAWARLPARDAAT